MTPPNRHTCRKHTHTHIHRYTHSSVMGLPLPDPRVEPESSARPCTFIHVWLRRCISACHVTFLMVDKRIPLTFKNTYYRKVEEGGKKLRDNCLCSPNHHLIPLGRIIMESGPFRGFDGGITITKINQPGVRKCTFPAAVFL